VNEGVNEGVNIPHRIQSSALGAKFTPVGQLMMLKIGLWPLLKKTNKQLESPALAVEHILALQKGVSKKA
jgi:hypothetical protein